MTELDHLAIAAHTLEQGLDYVRETLGVEMSHGGKHPRLGTHNRLLRVGESVYIEVIAIDPEAPPPARPRWFQLDDPAVQAELRTSPRLLTWVVRTSQIAEVFVASRQPLGAIEPMSRGDLRWLLTFANDGKLVDGGMIPSLIQWPSGVHPSRGLPDLGCTLERLEAVHPDPAAYRSDLASISADRHVEITAAAPGARAQLIAHIRTPRGLCVVR